MVQKHIAKTVLTGLLISFLTTSSPASAADRDERVRFASGATSATVSGSIRGYDGVKYQLGAQAGQVMSVLFSPNNPSCYFNVIGPGSNVAIFNGSTTGNEYVGNLPSSGDYTIQVYLMRNAARRNERCNYKVTFEIAGEARTALLPGAHGDDVAEYEGHFTPRDARRACQQRMKEQYGIRRSAISNVKVQPAGRGHFRVSGRVERYRSLPDEFNCRVVHDEVVSLRVHPPGKPDQAVGKAILGAVLLGTAAALAAKEQENEPHPAYSDGNPFHDRSYLNKACRHEIARQLRHSHSQFDQIRIATAHLRNRTLQGDGSIRWHGSNHLIHFTCHFDRRGQVVDGQFYYYPAHPAAYRTDYADGMAGGPDAWRVVDVASNDVLWVHQRARLSSPRIGSLPYDARGVRNFGCQWSDIDKGTWCEVEYKGLRGFAAQRYLGEDG